MLSTIKDLKMYHLAMEFPDLFDALQGKLFKFSKASPENTPEKYNNSEVYWTQYQVAFFCLSSFKLELLSSKDLLIFDKDHRPAIYQDLRFNNSFDMLLVYLERLFVGWVSILPLFSELYSNEKYKPHFGELEVQLIFYWLKLIPVIEETLSLLYSWKDTLFIPEIVYNPISCYYAVSHLVP